MINIYNIISKITKVLAKREPSPYVLKIYIFYDDHAEPHFHAYYGETEGKILVKNGKLLAGKLPPRAMKLVKDLMKDHKGELEENWKLVEKHKKLKKIQPLK